MEVNISGLKCDNTSCGYRNDDIEFKDYPAYINSKCPKCGEIWLTEKEYKDCLKIYTAVSWINKIGRVTRWINPMYYYRLIFGDKRTFFTFTKKY